MEDFKTLRKALIELRFKYQNEWIFQRMNWNRRWDTWCLAQSSLAGKMDEKKRKKKWKEGVGLYMAGEEVALKKKK